MRCVFFFVHYAYAALWTMTLSIVNSSPCLPLSFPSCEMSVFGTQKILILVCASRREEKLVRVWVRVREDIHDVVPTLALHTFDSTLLQPLLMIVYKIIHPSNNTRNPPKPGVILARNSSSRCNISLQGSFKDFPSKALQGFPSKDPSRIRPPNRVLTAPRPSTSNRCL